MVDLDKMKTTFVQLSGHCWADTAEGDPNPGLIIADDRVLIVDTLATPIPAALPDGTGVESSEC